GVIGRVLVEKPQKAGARANVGARHAKIRAVETALRGVRRIVAGVANPGHAKLGNQGGLVEQRNLVAGNLGVGDFYLAKSVAQKERVPGVELVGQLHGALVARFGEGVDVASLFRKDGGLKTKLGIAESIGRGVAEQSASLQGASAQLEGERIRAARQIEFADFENAAGSGLNRSEERRVGKECRCRGGNEREAD